MKAIGGQRAGAMEKLQAARRASPSKATRKAAKPPDRPTPALPKAEEQAPKPPVGSRSIGDRPRRRPASPAAAAAAGGAEVAVANAAKAAGGVEKASLPRRSVSAE